MGRKDSRYVGTPGGARVRERERKNSRISERSQPASEASGAQASEASAREIMCAWSIHYFGGSISKWQSLLPNTAHRFNCFM